jgi:hypothetical protein
MRLYHYGDSIEHTDYDPIYGAGYGVSLPVAVLCWDSRMGITCLAHGVAYCDEGTCLALDLSDQHRQWVDRLAQVQSHRPSSSPF